MKAKKFFHDAIRKKYRKTKGNAKSLPGSGKSELFSQVHQMQLTFLKIFL